MIMNTPARRGSPVATMRCGDPVRIPHGGPRVDVRVVSYHNSSFVIVRPTGEVAIVPFAATLWDQVSREWKIANKTWTALRVKPRRTLWES